MSFRRVSEWFRFSIKNRSSGAARSITTKPLTSSPPLHHLVTVGEAYKDGRYRTIQKLGGGVYSSVWLARDRECDRYVALKVLRADCYGTDRDIFELEILQTMEQHRKSFLASSGGQASRLPVLDLLDHFEHKPDSGRTHVCLVSPVLGGDLDERASHFEGYRIPWRATKDIARQLLLGLEFLHDTCQIIHTDLQPSNICFALESNFDQTLNGYVASSLPSKNQESAHDQHAARNYLATEQEFKKFIIDQTQQVTAQQAPPVTIIDFGVACWTHRRLSEKIQPEHLRAPEVTLDAGWGVKIDIWSLGCLIIEIMQGHLAFKGSGNVELGWTSEDDHLGKYIEVMGPMPQSLLSRSRRKGEFFNEDGSLRRISKLFPLGLHGYLINPERSPVGKPHDMPQEEVDNFLNFLSHALALDPDERWGAGQLLEHKWMAEI